MLTTDQDGFNDDDEEMEATRVLEGVGAMTAVLLTEGQAIGGGGPDGPTYMELRKIAAREAALEVAREKKERVAQMEFELQEAMKHGSTTNKNGTTKNGGGGDGSSSSKKHRYPTAAEIERVQQAKIELDVDGKVTGVASSVEGLWETFDTAVNIEEASDCLATANNHHLPYHYHSYDYDHYDYYFMKDAFYWLCDLSFFFFF
jgi:hypothetical protein